MTKPQDIIERVKWLQTLHAEVGSNGDIESWFNYSYLSFPAIAEALLIAVEALEEIKNGNVVCDSRNGDKGCDNKAHNALSRIRSIPL